MEGFSMENVYDGMPFIDVVCSGETVYAISSITGDSLSERLRKKYFGGDGKGGTLVIFRASPDGSLTRLSSVENLGNLRQLKISGKYAYLTAREEGLYIVDVGDPERPRTVCRWDTVEYASGAAVCGNIAAIGCRGFGVELLDVSDPASPVHLCVLRAGEVQSVYIDGDTLFTGSWGEKEVNIIDISDPRRPEKLSSVPLDGRGDGLCVDSGLLYAATGQHSRAMKRPSPEDDGYGGGNGFEIYDVRNPSAPRLLSRTKLPRYYFTYFDMWGIKVAYPFAYLSHTFNGMYVYDVSEPEAPKLLGHEVIRLPPELHYFQDVLDDRAKTLHPPIIPFDFEKELFGPVCGMDVSDGKAYAAGGLSGLHIARGGYYKTAGNEKVPKNTGRKYPASDYYESRPGDGTEGLLFRRTPSQARAAAWHEGTLYAACGAAGILRFEGEDFAPAGGLETCGFAMDVKFNGGVMYTAEHDGGLGLWRVDGSSAVRVGRFVYRDLPISQVVVSENGRHALLQCGCTRLLIVDVVDPENPRLELEDTDCPGQLYGRQISFTGSDGSYYCCYWNANRYRWYELSGEAPVRLPVMQRVVGGGVCGLPGGRALQVIDDGYRIFDVRSDYRAESVETVRVPGISTYSKPAVYGDKLFLTSRSRGNVCAVDMAERKILRSFVLSGNPDIAAYDGNTAAVPAGNQGVVFFRV